MFGKFIPESTRDMPITFLSGKNARYTYVYVTDEKRYLSDKKYNQNKRVCIGRLDYKLDSDWRAAGKYPTEMLPNDDFTPNSKIFLLAGSILVVCLSGNLIT